MIFKLAMAMPSEHELHMYNNPDNFYERIHEYTNQLQTLGVTIIKVTCEADFAKYSLDGTPSFSWWTPATDKWTMLKTFGPEMRELKHEVASLISQ